jgi:hypothetical protein
MNDFPWEVAFGLLFVMLGTLYWVVSILRDAYKETQVEKDEK